MDKKTRKLKIYSKTQQRAWNNHKDAPWLNVSGLWLDKAGFNIGCVVEITVAQNQLIIKKASNGN
jgi:toxic protein SymE